MTSETKPTLLAVLAHPDDESFGMGGTLAYYARKGVSVHLITATRGEAGDVDPEYMDGFSTIADRRESELRCAAGLLGLDGVHFLDYRDSGMPGAEANFHPQALVGQPLDKVAENLVCYIRELKPEIVVTFDPIGGYRHPDHIAIHQATVRAFYAAGDPQQFPESGPAYQPKKLFFHVMPHGLMRFAVKMMPLFRQDPRRFGRNKDIDLAALVRVSFPVHAVIDFTPVAAIRDKAAACHASQGGGMLLRGPFGWVRRRLGNKEMFMQAYPPPNGKVIKDLFEGK